MARMIDDRAIWILGTALIIPFLLFGTGMIETAYFLGALVFFLYFCLLILNFEAGFLVLIFIRSSLDSLKHFTSGGSVIIGAVSIALIILGAFYVLYRKVNILKFEDSGPFLIFLVFCAISIDSSPVPQESMADWLRILSVFSVYILTRILFVTPQKLIRLFAALLISSLLPVLAGLFQLMTGAGMVHDAGQNRIVGTFLHPNPFASYLMILLIFFTSQILEKTRLIGRGVLMVVTSLIFVVFIFTFSRGAWIAFGCAMIVMGFLRYRRILGYLPLLLIGSFTLIPAVQYRILNIFNAGYTHGRSAWDWRLETWSAISDMVAKKPILGHGLSSVESVYGVLTHNDYLRLAAEVGILGLLAYLWLSWSVIRQTWKDYQAADSAVVKSFQTALLACAAGILVREFADNTLRNAVVMMYFWIFIAISRNMARVYKEETVTAVQNISEEQREA